MEKAKETVSVSFNFGGQMKLQFAQEGGNCIGVDLSRAAGPYGEFEVSAEGARCFSLFFANIAKDLEGGK